MQVRTRVLAPTDTQGKRIKVSANGKSKTYLWRGDVEDMHMWAVSAFLNDKGYSAIGSITRIKDIGTLSALYKVKDYTELEMGNVLATAEMDGEESVRLKVMSDNSESKWLTITTEQFRKMIAVL